MEETVQDVEEKNKRLVDLLNANIYSKAEQYKEKVMNRLLDRPASAQPAAISPTAAPAFNSKTQADGHEPSPIRLQRIQCEDQEQKMRDRERYLQLAEKITSRQFQERTPTYSALMARGGEFEQRRMLSTADLAVNDQPAAVARLRKADTYKATNRFAEEIDDASPERIAAALKQQSPLRRKLAEETLTINRGPSVNDIEAVNPVPSKITHVSGFISDDQKTLISHELGELRN